MDFVHFTDAMQNSNKNEMERKTNLFKAPLAQITRETRKGGLKNKLYIYIYIYITKANIFLIMIFFPFNKICLVNPSFMLIPAYCY